MSQTDGDAAFTIEQLQAAIAAVQRGEGNGDIIDERLEEHLAPLKSKATRLISHRDRSVEELRRRLSDTTGADGETVDPDLVDLVIERCIANGMLDDARFAHEWVRQRQQNQRKSVSVLRRELVDKGVPAPVIEGALDQIDENDQDAILREVVTKKAGTVSQVPADRREYDKALRRIVGVAARRGFPEGRSLKVAREALELRIEELGGCPSR
ncbi:Recombination regulator RecX [Corynebacterium glyciniphilum AJ 3170]|uniref:Regulatory protein RecX n=1 Tax=Corynebacterium glyciniphilum AJ 3170 TaxID=1404245 RepID=X5E9A3_9CORY|nr:regulatory protein RecX [Corynebacterium glyciniphilum]AHW64010.1 Recombination regulator RecX [Corynebacterium glyciniphilum AJ 3170]